MEFCGRSAGGREEAGLCICVRLLPATQGYGWWKRRIRKKRMRYPQNKNLVHILFVQNRCSIIGTAVFCALGLWITNYKMLCFLLTLKHRYCIIGTRPISGASPCAERSTRKKERRDVIDTRHQEYQETERRDCSV